MYIVHKNIYSTLLAVFHESERFLYGDSLIGGDSLLNYGKCSFSLALIKISMKHDYLKVTSTKEVTTIV